MTTEEIQDLYRRAIWVRGRDAHWAEVVEKCGELIVAVMQYQRGHIGAECLAEEVADVQILCEQAASLLGVELVADAKASKLDRMLKRVTNAEERRPANTKASEP